MNMNWSVLVNPACRLGEGLLWSHSRQALMFVDIHGQRILQLTLSTGQLQEWATPQRVGWLIPRAHHSGFVAGFQQGFALVDLADTLSLTWLARPFGNEQAFMRLNDAKADAQGRIWAGCLNNEDESQAIGKLYCLNTAGELQTVDEGYCVPNGPAISPDGSVLLHTDSARRTIYAFDLDGAQSTVSNKRVWRVFAQDEGYPDGMNFDAQGCVWIAHWGAGCVSQFSMGGELLQRFKLPVSNATSVAFGGDGLSRLFVTTARQGLSEAQLALEPLAGAVFEIEGHGAQGLLPLAYGA
jgi:D-xylonolactonase